MRNLKMFELEDYSTGFHDGYLSKSNDLGNSLDFYISDSMQDMLNVDIRSEIANVVGVGSNELATLLTDLPNSFDHAMETASALNSTSMSQSGGGGISHHGDSLGAYNSWMAGSSSWSSSSGNDFFADVGACVNPISVMPIISSSIMHNHPAQSPKANLNSSSIRSSIPNNTSPPNSPSLHETTKSHLTFSPAQVKISAGSIRHEQILSHIPKQIVSISSAVTAGTTAPATLATNSALQRRSSTLVSNGSIESIKKDLASELRKVAMVSAHSPNTITAEERTKNSTSSKQSNGATLLNANGFNTNCTSASTIKLAPGIGGLTFANSSITYNKIKQQSSSGFQSPQRSPVSSSLRKERGSSPLTTLSNGSGGGTIKFLGRNFAQAATSFTPKSIASANSPQLKENNGFSVTNSSSSRSSSPSVTTYTPAMTPTHTASRVLASPSAAVGIKSLQQKIKTPATVESEYPKPAYSYSCLIAMALKNSRSGSLPVSEIYSFMCEHFPYFKTAPSGWKNSVRHNLSLNKCFEKIEKPATNGNQRKGCLWAMNPERIAKMDDEVQKWSRKDPMAIRNAMVFPEHLEALERGEMKHGSSGDSDVELDSQSEIEETSDLEEQEELDEAIVENMFVEEDVIDEEEGEIMGMNDDDPAGDNNSTMGDAELEQQQRDFDLEVADFYDDIEYEDSKDAVRMAIQQGDIIELGPADMQSDSRDMDDSIIKDEPDHQSPKRARLNVNYSIGPTGVLEKQIKIHQLKQSRGPVTAALQQLHVQHQPQHHIVLQTFSGQDSGGGVTSFMAHQLGQHGQMKPGTVMAVASHQNRRKMQLVNRIA